MSETPQRYDLKGHSRGMESWDTIEKDSDGDYVLFEDCVRDLTAAKAKLAIAESDIANLRKFASKIMEAWPHGGIDGGELQDTAEECGLLAPVAATAPCGENCNCQFYGPFPTTCFRPTPLLTGIVTPEAAP